MYAMIYNAIRAAIHSRRNQFEDTYTVKASQMLLKILESASLYQGGPLSPGTCPQESSLPGQISRTYFRSGRTYDLGKYVLRRYDLPHERLEFKDAVVFFQVSTMHSGGARVSRNDVSGLPISLNKGIMG